MFRRRFVPSILAVLLVVGLLAAGSYALVRIGWAQGYQVGLLAGGEAGPQALPYGPFAPFGAGFGLGFFPFLCGLGLLFSFGLFALRFLFFGRAWRAWKRHGGTWGEGWGPHHGPWWHEGRPEAPPTESGGKPEEMDV